MCNTGARSPSLAGIDSCARVEEDSGICVWGAMRLMDKRILGLQEEELNYADK